MSKIAAKNPSKDPQVLRVGPALLTYECTECKSKIQPRKENIWVRDIPVDRQATINASYDAGLRKTIITSQRVSVHMCPVCETENTVETTDVSVEPDMSINYCILV